MPFVAIILLIFFCILTDIAMAVGADLLVCVCACAIVLCLVAMVVGFVIEYYKLGKN